jgi:hypothetical protein
MSDDQNGTRHAHAMSLKAGTVDVHLFVRRTALAATPVTRAVRIPTTTPALFNGVR